jgi:hypothetical protein
MARLRLAKANQTALGELPLGPEPAMFSLCVSSGEATPASEGDVP